MHKVVSLVLFFVFGVILLSSPQVALAAGICPTGDFANLCNLSFNANLVGRIVTLLLILAIVLALIFLVWGGVRWIASGGDKAKVEAARSAIIAAIVGLVISLLAYFILNLVTQIVTGKSITNFTIPTLF